MHSEHKNEMNRSDENTRNSQIKFDKNKNIDKLNVKIYRLPPLLSTFFNQSKKLRISKNPWK